MKTDSYQCKYCGKTKNKLEEGCSTEKDGSSVCFQCCGILDQIEMNTKGKIYLYLTEESNERGIKKYTVGNWTGSLEIPVYYLKKGKHNWGINRYDFWFIFNGHVWHGVNYGENTLSALCKRTKETSTMRIHIKKNAVSLCRTSASFMPYSQEWLNKIEAIQGHWIPVETDYLFNAQFNTGPIEGVTDNGLRITANSVDAIENDIRPFKTRCDWCGKVFDKAFECPNCGNKKHLDHFNYIWKG